MNRRALSYLVALALLGAGACKEDQGHSHGPGSDHAHGPAAPTVSVTHWTARSELFMEYPTLVAGQVGRAAIHVTDLSDFTPLATGEAVVVLRDASGTLREFRAGPSQPGIFGVNIQVDAAGTYNLWVRVESDGLRDTHVLGPVTAYAPDAEIPVEDADTADAIDYLKEQQWVLEFETQAVAEKTIRGGRTVPATIQPRSGGDVVMNAPVSGRVDPAVAVPVPGTHVGKGAILARIAPHGHDVQDAAGLSAALVEAEQAHLLATQARDRARRLVEARAVPQRRLDEAAAILATSEAQLRAAQERWDRFASLRQSSGGASDSESFTVRASLDGVISEVHFTPGASVDANAPLLRIVDSKTVHAVGAIPEILFDSLSTIVSGELLASSREPIRLEAPLASSPVMDPHSRTSAVRFELNNAPLRLRIGQAAQLRLFTDEAQSQLAVPESALVDDGGQRVVYVQTGGESFQRRPVRLGSAEDGYVHILEGLEPGERVVQRGAYLVRLASMSTQAPSHGHVH